MLNKASKEDKVESERLNKELYERRKHRILKKAREFIEIEASCSEQDSSEDSGDSTDVMSGDFINNGAYTQASPKFDTGLSMYHSLHRSFLDESPGVEGIKYQIGARGKMKKTRHPMPVLETILDGRGENSICTSGKIEFIRQNSGKSMKRKFAFPSSSSDDNSDSD